jgi:hypothetical protein
MDHFIMGAGAMGFFIAGLFFLRFWTRTRDRLFALFAVAFWLLGLIRVGLVYAPHADESQYLYWIRLIAYLVILFAVIDKNRPGRT